MNRSAIFFLFTLFVAGNVSAAENELGCGKNDDPNNSGGVFWDNASEGLKTPNILEASPIAIRHKIDMLPMIGVQKDILVFHESRLGKRPKSPMYLLGTDGNLKRINATMSPVADTIIPTVCGTENTVKILSTQELAAVDPEVLNARSVKGSTAEVDTDSQWIVIGNDADKIVTWHPLRKTICPAVNITGSVAAKLKNQQCAVSEASLGTIIARKWSEDWEELFAISPQNTCTLFYRGKFDGSEGSGTVGVEGVIELVDKQTKEKEMWLLFSISFTESGGYAVQLYQRTIGEKTVLKEDKPTYVYYASGC